MGSDPQGLLGVIYAEELHWGCAGIALAISASGLAAAGIACKWLLAAPVAVKLIDREHVPDEETLGRFMREAQSAATLRSPHVV